MLPSLLYLPMVSNDLPSVLVSYAHAWSPGPAYGLICLPTYVAAYLWSPMFIPCLLGLPGLLSLLHLPSLLSLPIVSYAYLVS